MHIIYPCEHLNLFTERAPVSGGKVRIVSDFKKNVQVK